MTDDSSRQLLEALARGNMDEYRLLAEQLDESADLRAREVIHAGLAIQADARWGASTDTAEIRSWVADLRSGVETSIGQIDPVVCEKIIISVVMGDPTMLEGVPQGEITHLMVLMTFALAHDSSMSEDELREFLDQAEELSKD